MESKCSGGKRRILEIGDKDVSAAFGWRPMRREKHWDEEWRKSATVHSAHRSTAFKRPTPRPAAIAHTLIKQLEAEEIGPVKQIVPARQGAEGIEDRGGGQPDIAPAFERQQIRQHEKRQELDRGHPRMVHCVRDMRWVEGKYKSPKQRAEVARHKVAHEIERARSRPGERMPAALRSESP